MKKKKVLIIPHSTPLGKSGINYGESYFDPLGSYTGYPIMFEVPVQDVDDL